MFFSLLRLATIRCRCCCCCFTHTHTHTSHMWHLFPQIGSFYLSKIYKCISIIPLRWNNRVSATDEHLEFVRLTINTKTSEMDNATNDLNWRNILFAVINGSSKKPGHELASCLRSHEISCAVPFSLFFFFFIIVCMCLICNWKWKFWITARQILCYRFVI